MSNGMIAVVLVALALVALVAVVLPLRPETIGKLLIGVLIVLALLFCVAVTSPLRRPSSEPATPLTAAQLAQRPLLLYPGATQVAVTRETRTFGPDERRPNRSRYLWRTTTFRSEGMTGEIMAHYRQNLVSRGWVDTAECERYPSKGYSAAYFHRPGGKCGPSAGPNEMISIIIGTPELLTHNITISEMLPAPLEWPDPPIP